MGLGRSTLGVDIGGTTGKMAVLQRGEQDKHVLTESQFGDTGERVQALEVACPFLGGNIHFLLWLTESTGKALDGMLGAYEGISGSNAKIFATGGGAYRFEDQIHALGASFHKVGEFDALIDGLRFILQHIQQSVYCVRVEDGSMYPASICWDCFNTGRFPVLVCNIGTGVSILKVTADGAERVGGTSIGGSTFLGMVYQLTSAKTFADAMSLAQQGDTKEVDLLVQDIYGKDCGDVLGIPGDLIASSFGRLTRNGHGESPPSEAALAASVCALVTQSIALYACQLARRHSCRDVIFTGGFLERNELARQKLAFFVSHEFRRGEGEGRALFLHHAEFAGAIGCMSRALNSQNA